MSKRGLAIGDSVRVGIGRDRKWTGKVIGMERGEDRGDWIFTIQRDQPKGKQPEARVPSRYVRRIVPSIMLGSKFSGRVVVIPPAREQ